jgi:hypothetical protein
VAAQRLSDGGSEDDQRDHRRSRRASASPSPWRQRADSVPTRYAPQARAFRGRGLLGVDCVGGERREAEDPGDGERAQQRTLCHRVDEDADEEPAHDVDSPRAQGECARHVRQQQADPVAGGSAEQAAERHEGQRASLARERGQRSAGRREDLVLAALGERCHG